MKNLLILVWLHFIITQDIVSELIDLPFSFKKYDQSDILLEEEDRRDLLRDIKTVYAPEYRIYTNGSIGTLVSKEKREVCRYCKNLEEFVTKCKGKKFKTTSIPVDEDDKIQMAKENILETFDVDNNLLETPDRNSWLNITNYIEPDIQQEQDIEVGSKKKISDWSSLDLSVFWHNEVGTSEIRKLQGAK